MCARLSVAMAARVGGKKKYPGTAVITVSLASEDRYSICDYEASFTLATPSVSRCGGGAEDGAVIRNVDEETVKNTRLNESSENGRYPPDNFENITRI